MNPRVGVLALQGDVREHLSALSSLGASSQTVRTAAELAEVEALVIPGGESTTMSKLAERMGVIGPLRQAASDGMPMFGSCAGMIMLARSVVDGRADQQTLGALDIVVRRNAFGRQVDSFEADVEIPALTGPKFPAVFIRAPWVESVGAGVEVLATIPGGEQGEPVVAVRSAQCLATSFHPELTGDPRIHQLFLDMVAQS